MRRLGLERRKKIGGEGLAVERSGMYKVRTIHGDREADRGAVVLPSVDIQSWFSSSTSRACSSAYPGRPRQHDCYSVGVVLSLLLLVVDKGERLAFIQVLGYPWTSRNACSGTSG